jgi:hypothetical protein
MSSEEWHEENRNDLAMTGYSDEEIYEATAVWYLKNHDDWKKWVPDEVAKKVTKALANE